MKLPKIKIYYLILALLLAMCGWFAMGFVGIILAFWTMLLWFSVWQRPYRVELFLIAGLGLLGAVAILPENHWRDSNVSFLLSFMIVAFSPLVDLCWAMIRKKEKE